MDSPSLTFLMHGNVRKDAADRFDIHFLRYNAWQHYTISIEARHKLLRHEFLPARRYASAGNSDRNVSVCPSVRPSRAGIVSKRRKLAA